MIMIIDKVIITDLTAHKQSDLYLLIIIQTELESVGM